MENDEMTNDAAVAWSVLEIGKRGAAYDLPWVKRAFTYDHQPGNVDASKLGRAANTAVHMSAGDSIDRGLALLRTLQDEGFGVFQIGPELAQDATTVAELRARTEAAERRVAELESQFNSVLECLSHFASVAAKDGDTFADTAINGITELTNTIEKEEARGLAVREAAQSIDDSWDALMDTQPVIPVSINKLRELRATLTKESP